MSVIFLFNSVELFPGHRLWKHDIYVGPLGLWASVCLVRTHMETFQQGIFLEIHTKLSLPEWDAPPTHRSFLAEQTCQFEVPVDIFVGFGFVFSRAAYRVNERTF